MYLQRFLWRWNSSFKQLMQNQSNIVLPYRDLLMSTVVLSWQFVFCFEYCMLFIHNFLFVIIILPRTQITLIPSRVYVLWFVFVQAWSLFLPVYHIRLRMPNLPPTIHSCFWLPLIRHMFCLRVVYLIQSENSYVYLQTS